MFFKQFYLQSLGHASYLVGSEQTGEMLALDVRRDVDEYFSVAHSQGMRIAYAADTHQHNDYVSGICELPQRSDVQLLAGARAELGYKVRKMENGQRMRMGEVEIEFMHTPGHTPEHISLLVTDRSRGDTPALLMSGGALLVDDIARPDLLGGEQQTRKSAESFCHTLQEKILPLPDYVQVYPTHVAGSLCGGNIGSRLSTTIGYERRMNKLLNSIQRHEEFVKHCLELKDLPAVPPYWSRMRKYNQEGPPVIGVPTEPPALTVDQFKKYQNDGAYILDCRSPEAYHEHIPGSLNVGDSNAFPTWAGTVLPDKADILLILESPDQLWNICWHLLRIGYELPVGWLAGGLSAWRVRGNKTEMLPQWNVFQLQDNLQSSNKNNEILVLDVRQPAEWTAGHIPHALHITGAELPQRLNDLPRDNTVAVICGSGYRSSVCASLLQSSGQSNIVNVAGGMGAWQAAGFETVHE